jgi:hypothetical protein
MLSAEYYFADCPSAQCHYARCRNAKCPYAEWRNAECRSAERHGASELETKMLLQTCEKTKKNFFLNLYQNPKIINNKF